MPESVKDSQPIREIREIMDEEDNYLVPGVLRLAHESFWQLRNTTAQGDFITYKDIYYYTRVCGIELSKHEIDFILQMDLVYLTEGAKHGSTSSS